MMYWPGTNIVKSKNNAFDWKTKKSQITQNIDFINSNRSKLQMAGAASAGKVTILTIKEKK